MTISSLETETCRLTENKQEQCEREAHTNTLCAEAQAELNKISTRLELLQVEEKCLKVSISTLQKQSNASAEHIVLLEAEERNLTRNKQELCEQEAHTNTLAAQTHAELGELTKRLEFLRVEEEQLGASIPALQTQKSVLDPVWDVFFDIVLASTFEMVVNALLGCALCAVLAPVLAPPSPDPLRLWA